MNFKEKIAKSRGFNLSLYQKSNEWKLLEKLYNENFALAPNTGNVLPKKIHQVWVGNNPFPDKYKKWAESWTKFNSDWEYTLWTDVDVDSLNIPNRKQYDACDHVGQRSDILRYNILYQHGGLYVDTDFECLKSFDDLTFLELFIGVATEPNCELYVGLIGSVPKHPVLEKAVNSMTVLRNRVGRDVLNTSSTYYFTRVFFETVKEYEKGIVGFPFEYFYPFPNYMRKEENINPYDSITKHSYAIHHWEVSWSHKNLKRHGLGTGR